MYPHIMIITVWAVFVALLVRRHILSEGFLAFLAHEGHFRGLGEPVRLHFGMTFRAIVPLLTAGCTNGYLCIENMFAVGEKDGSLAE